MADAVAPVLGNRQCRPVPVTLRDKHNDSREQVAACTTITAPMAARAARRTKPSARWDLRRRHMLPSILPEQVIRSWVIAQRARESTIPQLRFLFAVYVEFLARIA